MNKKTLEQLSQGRDNNLNLVRLIAAFMVMYMHSLAMCQANQEADLMYTLTFHKALSGQVGVDIFFVISGFLIYRSYERSESLWKYLKARFLRIWPLLAVFILSTAFFFGPSFSSLSRQEYFETGFQKYLLNLVFISSDNRLPGVFANHINKSANGSIWTLQYEVICYLLVIAIVPLIKKYKKAIFAIIGVSAFMYLFFNYYWTADSFYMISKDRFVQFGRLSLQFEIGAMYYLYRQRIVMDVKLFVGALAGLIALDYLLDFEIAFAIFGAYVIIYVGFSYYWISKYYNKIGDLSYAVYILSFFIQQRIIDVMGVSPDGYQVLRMDPYINLGITTLIVLPLAFVSWHCFEKQVLKLK